MYKNKEGYTDPTAGAAMATIMKEYRQNQRRIYRKHSEIKARPKVYVVSKYAGDIEGNTAAAIRYARFAIEKKCLPVVSHRTSAAGAVRGSVGVRDRALIRHAVRDPRSPSTEEAHPIL